MCVKPSNSVCRRYGLPLGNGNRTKFGDLATCLEPQWKGRCALPLEFVIQSNCPGLQPHRQLEDGSAFSQL